MVQLFLGHYTSHLDNESERLIQAALENLTKDRTCFIIAHRLSTVRKADMAVVFSEGRIESVGKHEDLWDTSPTYRKLHALHLSEKRPKTVPIRGWEEEDETLVPAVGE